MKRIPSLSSQIAGVTLVGLVLCGLTSCGRKNGASTSGNIAANIAANGNIAAGQILVAAQNGDLETVKSLLKVNPILYLKKTAAPLIFAFTSRSSAATLPMTIKAQTDRLGVSKIHADLAGSFGTTIGQNGCAGVYPAVVATLVASALGWNVWSLSFILPLVFYITISSIGIAGVGGGATNATILVLSLLGLPIELVAILVSVEFFIDMGRTALNVNDAILTGVVVSKWEKAFNEDILYDRVPAIDTKPLNPA